MLLLGPGCWPLRAARPRLVRAAVHGCLPPLRPHQQTCPELSFGGRLIVVPATRWRLPLDSSQSIFLQQPLYCTGLCCTIREMLVADKGMNCAHKKKVDKQFWLGHGCCMVHLCVVAVRRQASRPALLLFGQCLEDLVSIFTMFYYYALSALVH